MVNYVSAVSTSASSVYDGTKLTGIDLITSIEILLVQDYDNQLKGAANELKGMINAKKAYRKDIQELQKLLTGKTEKKGDKDCVKISVSEYNRANNVSEYNVEPETGKVHSHPSKDFGSLAIQETAYSGKWPNRKATEYYVTKESIEHLIESVKTRFDTLNEQSELMSLGLQTLTNQRKIGLETVSNITRKQSDASSTIVGNMRS